VNDPDNRAGRYVWEYDRPELIADGIIHAIGVMLGLVGVIVLVATVATSAHALELASVLSYTTGLLAMLCLSAAYNMWPISPVKWVLRRLDHSAIYLLIAGTYTPFIAQMKSGATSAVMLVGVWLAAIAGVTLKLALPGRFDRLAVVFYLLLGWSGAFAYDAVAPALPSSAVWLLAAGGVLYSIGVVFHAWQSLRFQNAIWHGFVLLGALCHYFAVFDVVARAAAPS
jgi:hemolysin III